MLRSRLYKPGLRRTSTLSKTHLQPNHNLRSDHTVTHSGVLGETVDYASERVGVEELHRSMSHSLEHGIVERVAEVDQDSTNQEGS